MPVNITSPKPPFRINDRMRHFGISKISERYYLKKEFDKAAVCYDEMLASTFSFDATTYLHMADTFLFTHQIVKAVKMYTLVFKDKSALPEETAHAHYRYACLLKADQIDPITNQVILKCDTHLSTLHMAVANELNFPLARIAVKANPVIPLYLNLFKSWYLLKQQHLRNVQK